MVLAFFYFCLPFKAGAEVNQYGVDCSLTPWFSSCQLDENSGEFINPQKDDDVTSYNIGDDGHASVPLPFEFTLHDKTFVHSWMHSNGVISFLTIPGTANNNVGTPYNMGNLCCEGEDIEGILSGTNSNYSYYSSNGNANYHGGIPYISYSIAALWTDLININKDLDGDGVNDTGYFTRKIDTNGDGDFDTMRYYWRNISEYYNDQTNNTFGVEITEQNTIEMHYFDVDIRNHSVTIAITGDLDSDEVEQFTYYQNQTYDFTDIKIQQLAESYTNSNSVGATILNFDLAGACAVNPLINENCTGYAEAYAELVYQQNCANDPLYDIGCTGYEQAYYNQQCELDPLYDSGCTGYETAYFNQQCELDTAYDAACPGYEEYILSLIPDDVEEDNPTTENTSSTSVEVVSIESFTEPEITGDAVIDEVINDADIEVTADPTDPVGMIVLEQTIPIPAPTEVEEVEISEPEITEQTNQQVEDLTIAQLEEEVTVDEYVDDLIDEPTEEEDSNDTETESESSSDVDEPVGNSGDEESSDSDETNQNSSEENTDEQDAESPKSSGKSDDEKRESKRNKIKQLAKARAMQLANRMSQEATLEAQQAVQAQILALINFNPDFAKYQNGIPGGEMYGGDIPDGNINPNSRGLRNGLAQQLLHEKMVDMQYK